MLFVFGRVFSGGTTTGGGALEILGGPGPQPIDPFFWLKV